LRLIGGIVAKGVLARALTLYPIEALKHITPLAFYILVMRNDK